MHFAQSNFFLSINYFSIEINISIKLFEWNLIFGFFEHIMDLFILYVGRKTFKLLLKGIFHLFEISLRKLLLFGLYRGNMTSSQIEQLCFLEILKLEIEKLISLIITVDNFLVILIFGLIFFFFIV